MELPWLRVESTGAGACLDFLSGLIPVIAVTGDDPGAKMDIPGGEFDQLVKGDILVGCSE